MTVSEFCAACRNVAGLDQVEFAKAIGLLSERSFQTISNYENGTTLPSFKVLGEMARVAGTTLDEAVVFLDPALKQTREQENEEVVGILGDLLHSPIRDQIISYLRTFVRTRRDKPPRSRPSGRVSGKGGRTEE